ncbi:hypothetical protein GCM10011391_24380 [Pullulanibacillus camelliae]|uniref:Uncharacterized protein n=1 Tax=Pullulanibacillus camelliae TaxID=1707096 RepID=A0A8J3DVB6_9BACL|nr:hypothetical protein [Pullulanibacillus camelliae]GGE44679.1 hypothetical protein GCM10011391_24380 [Pullulanibacillus camelliae]
MVQAKFSNNVSNYNFVEDLISLGFDFGRLKLVGIQSKAEASNQDMSAAKVSIAFLNNKICIKITSAYRLNKNPL